ncbi:flagellin [Amnibacterium sp. CER49]|uniref:flagellin N-terminal helical domain-containing protein n=1 Tax=Amnibacterium sp. CER49 TaxID=3039161 RepID=UPI00244D5001|nr:flagellin [Amnibacterium sp. CER49]MDH2443845.1 flagellin [Amnibacterium sp. CER49]
MGFAINTNIDALNTYRNLTNVQNSLSSSLAKLSSGLRINNAGDDAAGLTISTALGSQVSGLQQASRNAQDGVSVVQTADGGLSQAQSLLGRLRDLAVQAGNDSNSATARTAIQTEATSITNELTRLSTAVKFNGTALLDGTATALTFQVGADAGADNQIAVNLSSANLGGIATTLASNSYASASAAQSSITAIDTALGTVSTARASIGALENRFASAVSTISTSITNLSAAKSRITDVDMAQEMVNYSRSNVLSQAGTAMLAQANASTQGILKLLQ